MKLGVSGGAGKRTGLFVDLDLSTLDWKSLSVLRLPLLLWLEALPRLLCVRLELEVEGVPEGELTFQVMFDGVPGREDTSMGRKAEPVNGDTGVLLKVDEDTEVS